MEMPLEKKITFTSTGEKQEAKVTSSNTNILEARTNTNQGSGEIIITPKTIGKATITLTIPESTNYKEASKNCEVEVITKIRVFFDVQGGSEVSSKMVTYNKPYGELPTTERENYT
jgi:hypothetical protein